MNSFSSIFVTARDGLKLHVCEYADRRSPGLPVVCLPGLTRTAEDFHPLASALAGDPIRPRRVLALDYRGRGQSDYDPDPDNYAIPVELDDVISVLTACEIAPAVFLGTSRGGLLTMLLGAARPTAVAGCVLNDIGPVIEPKGLMRIKSYVGNVPAPRSFEEGADMLERLFVHQFPKLDRDAWLAFARRTWRLHEGRLVLTYDVNLSRALAAFDPAQPVPSLWPQFDALAGVPVMVIRGANSDILSPETVAQMRARRRDLDIIEVPDQGHAPLLSEPDIIARVADFVGRCEIAVAAKV
jgi:pimeloyl-ACP methyl ester carboxylesterase